jgi:hypothetical protein
MKNLSQGKTLKACSWDRDYHCDGALNLVTIPPFYKIGIRRIKSGMP